MTGQDLLDAMEVLNQELQLQTSEADQARGLIALNMAQDYFEDLAAQEPKILGDTTASVTSTASTETTTFPTGFLRIDAIFFIDPTTSRPADKLDNLSETGSHADYTTWPLYLAQSTPGRPQAYWTNGRNIYWAPLPDATHTFRVYGFKRADNITSGGTFEYTDSLRLPFASFAVRMMKIGLGDEVADVAGLAKECFSAAIGSMTAVNRDGASPLVYRYGHDT